MRDKLSKQSSMEDKKSLLFLENMNTVGKKRGIQTDRQTDRHEDKTDNPICSKKRRMASWK